MDRRDGAAEVTCKSCGLDHRGWVSCAKAKADLAPVIAARTEPKMVANMQAVANAVANNHGKYADKEKRLAYMRELMRKRRAKPADT